MARLKQVKPQLRTLPMAVSMAKATGRARPAEDRSFYKTARWQKLRWKVLVRDAFTCQWPGCGKVEADTSKLVADHIEPVRVAPELTWDESNLRCLCKACHDGPRQAQEVAIYGSGPKGRGG